MIDWGLITTGIGTIIGGIITGLATWKSMTGTKESDLDNEQAKFMNRLVEDTNALRERINKMQQTIDTLMDERYVLKSEVTKLSIQILQQDNIIKDLRVTNDLRMSIQDTRMSKQENTISDLKVGQHDQSVSVQDTDIQALITKGK